MSSVIGIDLGGTKTVIARFDAESLACEEMENIPTRAEEGLASALDDAIAVTKKLLTKETKGIGVGIAGLIHQPDGIVIKTPNIKNGENVEAKKFLAEALKLPVHVQNDANCFALAEAVMGSGKGKNIVLGITMGTGVGGGIVINGKLFNGSHGFAGEFGHMLLQPGQPPFDSTDKRGEVEQFISGTAMGKRCVQAEKPEDYLEGQVCEWMQPDIFKEVAWMCTSLTYLFDPDIIVFGGSAGRALKPHLPKVVAELKKWTLPDTPLPELSIATVKDAGAMGAALLVK